MAETSRKRAVAALALAFALAACDRSVLLGSDEAVVAPDAPPDEIDFDGPLVHPPDRPDVTAEEAAAPDATPDAALDADVTLDAAPDADVALDASLDGAPDADAPDDVAPDLPRPTRVGPTVALALGGRHGCARSSDGALWCWGANDHGQLGDGTTTARARPTPLAGPAGVVALAAGADHTCALAGSRVWCWGRGGGGRLLRAGDTDASRPFDTGVEASAVAAGEAHTCVLRAGAVSCWGADDRGQLGGVPAGAAVPLPRPAVAVRAGGSFTCAALDDATAWCWGANDRGQLGRGALTPREAPGAVEGVAGVTSLALGDGHACARASGGTWCWGDRADGQLGDGTGAPRPRAARVDAWGFAEAIACGGAFTCGLSSPEARCAGRNDRGQLGDGTLTSRGEPVTTLGFPRTSLTLLAAGARHGCAETADRMTWCWGDGADGQLGTEVLDVSTTRAAVRW
ncbi:MAG: hypothetical protein U0324_13610 [Polyangiales bacterium]